MARHRKVQSITGAGKSVVPAGRDGHERAGLLAAILNGGIAAIGAIAAALIMNPADPAPPQPSELTGPVTVAPSIEAAAPGAGVPSVRAPQPSIHIESTTISPIGGPRSIAVKGSLDRLDLPGELYAVAAANEDPTRSGHDSGRPNTIPNDSRIQNIYISLPIAIRPDGKWETSIEIDPTETRKLTVRVFFLPPCDIRPMDNPLCGTHGPLDPEVHPKPPASIPTQTRPSAPIKPEKPRLDPPGASGPVVPPGITGLGGVPEIAEPVVPRHSEKLDVEQWHERNGPKFPRATSGPTIITVPHP